MTARAMVLCAGLGTRLRPLTDELPKPLVPVGNRSILSHALSALGRAGLRRAVINTHHLPQAFASALASFELEVDVVHESEIRGTAGGVAGARALLGRAPVILWNGDILAEPPLDALLAWREDGLCLAVATRPAGTGSVGISADGSLARLRGERFGDEACGGDYVGVAALGARCLATLPDHGCLIGDWALPELRRGGRIATVAHSGGWTDAGDIAAYVAANLGWLGPRATWIGERATIDPRVSLCQSLVGDDARVAGHGKLERVIVWPGARVCAPLSDAVVTTSGRVVAAEGVSA
jgi:mannose-1-phosphate guanylyltransferase